VNVLRRTLLFAGPPDSARWYDVADPDEKAQARALVYLRRRQDVSTGAFRQFIADEMVPALANAGVLKELRTQVFMPWNRRLWDTPNVAHDNPTDQRFHASLVLGFTDTDARRAYFASDAVTTLSARLPTFVSAVHAYEVAESLTYVRHGKILPNYQK
jgi:hypothetical protein